MAPKNVMPTPIPSQKKTENIQQMLVLLIPVTALLLIGACGSQMIPAQSELLFCALFLFGALLAFLGEKKVITVMQRARESCYVELTTACREFLAGNWEIKATVQGHGELATLTEAINLLLDQQHQLQQRTQSCPPQPDPTDPPSQPTPFTPAPQDDEAKLLKKQLMQMIEELSPITEGNLRVQISLPDSLVGLVANACNSLIEELTQFAKWTRYASQVVSTASRSILDRSIEMAKTSENQMQRLSATTNNIEELVSFMQHLNSNLYLNLDISKEVQRDIRTKVHPDDFTNNTPAGQLLNELQRQTESSEGILHSAEEISAIAESLIGDLYTVAQQTYQSSVGALKTVKRLSELEALAERWYSVVSAFTFFEDEDEKAKAANETWLL